MQKQYAIFGGSFNPIHVGHVSVVQQLLSQDLDQIIVIPTSRSPFKRSLELLPNALRWEMVQSSFRDWERVIVSDVEIQRKQIGYTYDTLKSLDKQYPDTAWHLVLGWDAYQDFQLWKNASWILKHSALWVIQRSTPEMEPPSDLETRLKEPIAPFFTTLDWQAEKQTLWAGECAIVRYFSFNTPIISSTDLRAGKSCDPWIPERARQLYVEYLAKKH